MTTPMPGLVLTPDVTIPAYAPIGNMILRFDGIKQFVSIPNSDEINFHRDQSYTVECWVRPEKVQPNTKAEDNELVEKWTGAKGYPYVLRYMNQTNKTGRAGQVAGARWDGAKGTAVFSNVTIDDGEFHHVAFVFAAGAPGTLSMFIDGALTGGPVDDTTLFATENDSPVFLGRRGQDEPYPNFFAGDLGRVLIWKGALTQEQVAASMYATYWGPQQLHGSDGVLTASLVGNWRGDEGYGNLVHDYSGGNGPGVFGGGKDDEAPAWAVSTILPRYDVFVPQKAPPTGPLTKAELASLDVESRLAVMERAHAASQAKAGERT